MLGKEQQTLETLSQLSLLGIQLALDDFGTGFSSISHLIHYPIDMVKIDKILIQSAAQSQMKQQYVLEGLALMLNKLDLRITAEGVETQAQAEQCQQLGIDCVQGQYYYPPMALQPLKMLLKKHGQHVYSDSRP